MTLPAMEPDCAAAVDALMDPAEAARLAGVAKALSDPVRLRVYAHIAASGPSTVCACHLPGQLGITQPTLSHHLKKLVDVGLVGREYRGRWAHYSPRPEALGELGRFLQQAGVMPTAAR
ncbi:MAG: metalloregulator ArsR/SmtB family transcription factor [Propionibacteriaceae bacterium]|nr:metalloregulator ArsR/SmtB family transcription factor [Propionibacteriaceae bacterium]